MEKDLGVLLTRKTARLSSSNEPGPCFGADFYLNCQKIPSLPFITLTLQNAISKLKQWPLIHAWPQA